MKIEQVAFNPEWLSPENGNLMLNCAFADKGTTQYGNYLMPVDYENKSLIMPGRLEPTDFFDHSPMMSYAGRFKITPTEIIQSVYYNFSGRASIKEVELLPAVAIIRKNEVSVRLGHWHASSRPSVQNAVEKWVRILVSQGVDDLKGVVRWKRFTGKSVWFTNGETPFSLIDFIKHFCFLLCHEASEELTTVNKLLELVQVTLKLPTDYGPMVLVNLDISGDMHKYALQYFSEARQRPYTPEQRALLVKTLYALVKAHAEDTMEKLGAPIPERALTGAELDVLHRLGKYGPAEDGELPSKGGMAGLIEKGLAEKDYNRSNANALTELGMQSYQAAFPNLK